MSNVKDDDGKDIAVVVPGTSLNLALLHGLAYGMSNELTGLYGAGIGLPVTHYRNAGSCNEKCLNDECSNTRELGKLFCSRECKQEHDEICKLDDACKKVMQIYPNMDDIISCPYGEEVPDAMVLDLLRVVYRKRFKGKAIGLDDLEWGRKIVSHLRYKKTI